MNERSIIITEKNGTFQIDSSQFSEIEVLGVLEQFAFDIKSTRTIKTETAAASSTKETAGQETIYSAPAEPPAEPEISAAPPKIEMPKAETLKTEPAEMTQPASPIIDELRTRIGNAVKAVRDLGGRIEQVDLTAMDEGELQAEFEALTNQYKRLKMSKKAK